VNGGTELEYISDLDMLALAKLWLRAERLHEEIDSLRMASRARQRTLHEAWLASLG
jgi:hypothetical protein